MARIMIVDDDPDIVESVTMVLQKNDHEVIQADGGVEGLEKAKSEKPDAIILDVMMPGMTGFELLEAFDRERLQHLRTFLPGHVLGHVFARHRSGLEPEIPPAAVHVVSFNPVIPIHDRRHVGRHVGQSLDGRSLGPQQFVEVRQQIAGAIVRPCVVRMSLQSHASW